MRRALMAFAFVLLVAAPAGARSSDEYTYSYEQMWRAAVRLVAVDFRFPITERDPDIGYLLFDYRDQGRSYPGSLELVRARGADGTARVRVVVQVGAMPSYVERMMLDHFARKLREDYGSPPVIRRPPPPPPDAGVPDPSADEDAPSDAPANPS